MENSDLYRCVSNGRDNLTAASIASLKPPQGWALDDNYK